MDRAIAAEGSSGDYPRLELVKEAVKAAVRSYVIGPRPSRSRSSAGAKPA